MKKLIAALAIISSLTAIGAEIDLRSVKNTTYGECVESAMLIRSGAQRPKSFKPALVKRAEERAVDFYRAYSNWYTVCGDDLDGPQDCPLYVESTLVRLDTDSPWSLVDYGIKVVVHMYADEDIVTFYFLEGRRENQDIELQLAYHSEQSPTAYWVCE